MADQERQKLDFGKGLDLAPARRKSSERKPADRSAPKPRAEKPAVETVRAAASELGFRSREPAADPGRVDWEKINRHRDAPRKSLTFQGVPETVIDDFKQFCDANGKLHKEVLFEALQAIGMDIPGWQDVAKRRIR